MTVDGPVVSVRDHGAGYPAYLIQDGPQRFRTESGGKGHGLGLTIAAGQAEVIGAELVFTNAPRTTDGPDDPDGTDGGGAVARLTLPEYVRLDDPLDDRDDPDDRPDDRLGDSDGRGDPEG